MIRDEHAIAGLRPLAMPPAALVSTDGFAAECARSELRDDGIGSVLREVNATWRHATATPSIRPSLRFPACPGTVDRIPEAVVRDDRVELTPNAPNPDRGRHRPAV